MRIGKAAIRQQGEESGSPEGEFFSFGVGAQRPFNERMICARCGTAGRPIGPRHSIDSQGRDCLRYACSGCGYSWIEMMRNRGAQDIVTFPSRGYRAAAGADALRSAPR